jgi:hypothetical protein
VPESLVNIRDISLSLTVNLYEALTKRVRELFSDDFDKDFMKDYDFLDTIAKK